MTRFADVFKEHWEKGAAVVALVFEAAMAFERHLAEISLETRFVIAGIAGAVGTLLVTEMLSWRPKRVRAGFQTDTKRMPSVSIMWVAVRAIVIVCLCTISVFLLDEIATFHNVRLLQRTDSGNPAVGTIEIQPAHTPTNLAINLSTRQANNISILDKAPASWNNQDPVDWRMQNDTPYGVTLFLREFKSPQVFGCWYRLSARSGELDVDVTIDPANVRVLRSEQLHRYRLNSRIFGGFLCLVALFSWCYRSCWFQLST
jgi:heme/copper-type cytochrome/quinol oxidase subunit 2